MKKNLFVIPETDVFQVGLGNSILDVSNGVNYSTTPGGAGGDDDIEDGGSF